MARLFLLLLPSLVRAEESVAVILAGMFRGTERTALEAKRALLAPLHRAGMSVSLYTGGHAKDEAAWREWGRVASGDSSVAGYAFVPLPQADDDSLQASFWRHCSQEYHVQYGALYSTWSRITNRSSYTYVIRTRNDLLFPDVQAFKPCWFRELPRETVLTTDIEIHQGDRWNERGLELRVPPGYLDYFAAYATFGLNVTRPRPMSKQARFPTTTCDQFFAGRYEAMDLLLSLDAAPPWTPPCPSNGGIENILAIHLFSNGVDVYTVTLSPRRNDPKSAETGPTMFRPDRLPCSLCFDCFDHGAGGST